MMAARAGSDSAVGDGGPVDARSYASAILNILEDAAAEKAQLAGTQRAVLNILDDSANEEARLADTQRAILNILDDAAGEKTRLESTQRAVLNILDDSAEEKARLADTQRAALNILEDFDIEKKKVERINREMAEEIAERKQAEERLGAQYAVTRVLADAASLGEATPKLLRTVCETLGWQLGEIWEIDRTADVLRCAGMWQVPALSVRNFEAVTRETSFTLGVGLPGRVRSTAQPIWMPDVLEDPTFVRRVDAAKEGLHAAFGFPILIAGEVTGVVDFLSHEVRPPDNDLMQMMSAFGSQIGQFIQRKWVEEKIRTANAQLEVANEGLEAFSYSVAHDLRAPLRSVDGFSQALLEDYADRLDAEGKKYLGHIRGSAQQMAELIDDLLELARVSRADLRHERVDLSELARSVLAQLRESQPERRVEVIIQDGVVVQADPRLLEVVLTNLLGNAWKFTGKRAFAQIEFAAAAGERTPVYLVRDNGAGFDAAYAGKLFGVFQRLHAAHEFEGTGIGLATVDRIVRRHGGRVWAEGVVDRGATFYFTLEEDHA